jgi:hypothetical protein
MIVNHYVVYHKRGRMFVSIPADVVEKRGINAVKHRAWQQLMGKDALDDDVDKKSPTREILMDEMLSRYRRERAGVYTTFVSTVKVTLLRISHG